MRPSASTRQCWRSTPRSRSRRCARSCAPSALTSRSSAPTGSCASSSTACRGTASSACSTFSSLSATPRCLHVRQLRAHCMRAWQRTRAARPARAGRPCAFQRSYALCAFAGSAVALCMYRVLHVATARGRARESPEIGGVRTEQRERERERVSERKRERERIEMDEWTTHRCCSARPRQCSSSFSLGF